MPELPGRILVGAAYYPEYTPYERLATDLDLMVAGGFSVIRVGESTWSTWEPREGELDLEWMAPVLDAADARGLRVIMGTPTYAAPPWLRRRYPETVAHVATGVAVPYGARQDIDYAHPTFRRLAERIVRAIAGRYGSHPAVIGWQVDNEPGYKLLFNPDVFASFVETLKTEYGTPEELDRRWGLAYWSHRIADWDELWTPDLNTTPAYDLAWRRHQASLAFDLITWQAAVIRELVPADRFVTTCVAPHHRGQDLATIGRPLDVTSVNIYYSTQDDLAHPGPDGLDGGIAPDFVPWGGPAFPALQADIARGIRDEPYLVTETNATSVGGSADNRPAWPGQLRQAAWLMIARGARMLEYWQWHTQHYGAESYWGGVLGHSMEHARTYEELAAVAREVAAADADLAGLRPDAGAALLVGSESRWALEFQGPLAGATHGWMGDRASFDRILASYYRAMFDAGVGVDIVAPRQLPADPAALVERWPVLVAVALYVADDATLDLLARYAEAGGHLVLTPRTGYADAENVIRPVVAPGALRGPAGVHYDEYTNLPADVRVTGDGWSGAGHAWADGLVADDADVLARYDHPFLGRFAAVATRRHGRGRVTTVGTLPDRTLGRDLGRWLAGISLPPDPWRDARPATVTVQAALDPAGRRLRVVHNWSWIPATLPAPTEADDLLTGERIPAGAPIALGPWDVRVLREADGAAGSDPQPSADNHEPRSQA
jgi:beta-galactosidase